MFFKVISIVIFAPEEISNEHRMWKNLQTEFSE